MDVLGPGGWLARIVRGWESRDAQLEMATAIQDLLDVGGTLAIEAPTGVGKTLAYLVPSLLSGHKVVVSTQSKALQDQIVEKDLPRLRAAFRAGGLALEQAEVEDAEHEGGERPLRYAVMKGRANYVCWERLERRTRQTRLALGPEAAVLGRIAAWARTSARGDRAELAELPEDDATFREVDARAETCVGTKCAHWERCFVVKMRREAELADLVVVNHHLLAADLALRAEARASREGRSFGAVIPQAEVLVVDEAHGLEESAAEHFGGEVSTRKLARLVIDVTAWAAEQKRDDAYAAVMDADHAVKLAFAELPDVGVRVRIPPAPADDGRAEPEPGVDAPWPGDEPPRSAPGAPDVPELPPDAVARLRARSLEAERALAGLAAVLSSRSEDATVDALARRASSLAEALAFIVAAADRDFVYWGERRGPHARLGASPVEVGEVLREVLYGQYGATVFASATLAVAERGKGLGYFLGRVGAPRDAKSLVLDTPFAFDRQAALYLPSALPEPGAPNAVAALADEARALVELVGGGAFFLFTSYRTLREVEALLRPGLRFPLLVQGEAPRARLLETFVARAPAVLLATTSFWEGIDVPGDPLRLVMIDRLPFAVPSDPVVRARIDRLEQLGRSAFRDYQLPQAIIRLKQGFGRLVRTRDDHGVVALFDPRVQRRSYGRRFLDALPPARRVYAREELVRWWAETRAGRGGSAATDGFDDVDLGGATSSR